jgi:hypothetical protein
MNNLDAWIITIIGILLVLPLAGIDQLGTPTEGILAWLLALGVLAIGIIKLIKK